MKTVVKRLAREETGAALVMTLILLLIGSLIIAPVLGHMGTGIVAGEVHEKRMEQLYGADAGVEDAIWRIQSGVVQEPVSCGDPEQWSSNITVNGEMVEIWIGFVGDQTFRVISTTAGADSATAVESYVFYGSHWKNILNFGVLALEGNITIGAAKLTSSPPGQARIYANGDISITGGPSKVDGDAYATGEINDENKVMGTAYPYHDPIEFHLPDLKVYEKAADKGELIEGDLKVTEDYYELGPARITGNLEVASQAKLKLTGVVWVEGEIKSLGGSHIYGRGPLVAEGFVRLAGTAASATEEMPVIISAYGPITATGNNESFMVLYAPNGKIRIDGGADVNGAAIGKEVEIQSAACNAVYDMEVVDRVRAPHITVLTWQVELE